MNRPFRWLLVGCIAWGCLFAARRADCSEPVRRFFDGLRQRGYFEEALEYLDQLRQGDCADASFREVIDYEAGLTLIDMAHAGQPDAASEKLLDQAEGRLARFLAEHPWHVLAAAAKTQLAGVLVERGRLKAEQARSSDPAGRQQAIESVRALYWQARTALLASQRQFEEALDKLPRFIDPKDTPRLRQRDQVRRDLLQARLTLARADFEIAQTYDPGAPEQRANLREAAREYGDLYDHHRHDLGGLYARLGQARSLNELGQPDQARPIVGELLAERGDSEALAALQTQARRLAMEIALAPGAEKWREALAIYEDWRRGARGDDPAGTETAAIQYLAGFAALQYARSLRTADKDQAALCAECLSTARQTLAAAAQRPGRCQSKAKALLADPLLGSSPAGPPRPAGFAEARDRADAALDRMALAEREAEAAAARAGSPGREPGSSGPLAAEIVAARQEAIHYCTLALGSPASEVPAADRQWLRYCLAYLRYRAGDLCEAATGADALAREDPRGPQARPAAKVALAAYTALLNQAASSQQRRADGDQMLAAAEFIVGQWQDEPDAELIVGQAAWAAWLEAWRLPQSDRPPPAKLDALLERARQMLTAGVGQISDAADAGGKIAVSPALLASVLALAQIELSAGQADKAVAWLEDAKTGAQTLAEARPAAVLPELAEETYRTAVRAYVASKQWQKAEAALRRLEPAEPDNAAAVRQATQAMIRAGRDWMEQFQRLRSQQRTAELAELQASLERFLWQISERPQGNSFFSLLWVAESYFGLGAALEPSEPAPPGEGQKKTPSQAVAYYRTAADTYRTILRRCGEDKKFAPRQDALVALRIRLAGCLRRLGEHQEAIAMLAAVLKDRPDLVDAQVEAAYTYQAWGGQKPGCYLLAITGSRKYREIWGWGELARRLTCDGTLHDTLCEARYNLAVCRFLLARQTSAPAERAELLGRAEDDIRAAARVCPDKGGKSWYDKNEALLKIIRKARG